MYDPVAWAAITACAAGLAYAFVRPTLCSDVDECTEIDSELSTSYNGLACTGLATVFLHELASLMLTRKSISQAQGLLHNTKRFVEPSAFLCWSFLVLLIENAVLLMAKSPWYAHSAQLLGKEQPVYTIFYLEWLINVPILLVLAGRCALSMTNQDIARPLIITNLYIILAWSCYYVDDSSIRKSLVSLSFSMYGFASYDMIMWVCKFLRANPDSSSGLYLRPVLTVCLIVIFGIYGLVFLGRLNGSVTPQSEKLFFTFMDIGSKLLVSMIFTGVRSSQYNAMLLDMLANTNTSFARNYNQVSGDA